MAPSSQLCKETKQSYTNLRTLVLKYDKGEGLLEKRQHGRFSSSSLARFQEYIVEPLSPHFAINYVMHFVTTLLQVAVVQLHVNYIWSTERNVAPTSPLSRYA